MGTHEAAESVQLENLTKVFGKLTAVDNLTLNVAPGEVLGFLGPNGAGKTTVMRMLIGLLKPTSGEASILGFDVQKRDPKMLARIGYLPGTLRLYENLTSQEFLQFMAKMRKRNCDAQVANLAERLQLDLRRHIHDLSKGNLQKVGVIAAFMHEPDVLILDEPTSGLDPLMQREFEGMLDEAKARGAATLLSSHVMSEAETLGTRIAIINRGKLLMLDDMAELKLKTLKRLEFTFGSEVGPEQFRPLDGVRTAEGSGNRIRLEVIGAETELLRKAAELGAISVRSEEPGLDEIFLNLIANGDSK
jgi:ABC-2 type transport system ATP-binding protein